MLAGLLLGAGLITFAVLLAASEPTVVASSLGVARLRIASSGFQLSSSASDKVAEYAARRRHLTVATQARSVLSVAWRRR